MPVIDVARLRRALMLRTVKGLVALFAGLSILVAGALGVATLAFAHHAFAPLVVGTLVVLSIGAALAIACGHAITRRVATIERSVRSVIAGDLAQRISIEGTGHELDRLSAVLNQMLDGTARLVEDLGSASSTVAHELRTPLGRLRAKLEQAAAIASDEQQREMLETAIEESDGLIALFGGLLAIAEIDGSDIRQRFAAFDLAEAASAIAEAHRPALEDQDMTLTLAMAPVTVCGDRALLQQMIANLLDNTLRHATTATKVEIAIFAVAGEAVVRVADDGPGVPPADRQRMFERLVRLDPDRSGAGHGLGLSAVTAIARAHRGAVAVAPSPVGLAIAFRMPLA